MPPAKKPTATVESYAASHLVDIPIVYFLDRSQWTDFKRALNNCGLTWNLPDWMTTIVYKGDDWKRIANTEAKTAELEDVFRAPVLEMGDEKKVDIAKLSSGFMKGLGYPEKLGEYIQPSSSFCNLKKLEFEKDSKLPARRNSGHGS